MIMIACVYKKKCGPRSEHWGSTDLCFLRLQIIGKLLYHVLQFQKPPWDQGDEEFLVNQHQQTADNRAD